MPTFDPSTFGLPTYTGQSSNTAMVFAVLAILFDLVFVLAVVKEALERDANPLAWGLFTLCLPLIGYVIWKASASREDSPPDMSLILRERRRGSRRTATPPKATLAPPPTRRPRNFF
jgi:hypothetical protein